VSTAGLTAHVFFGTLGFGMAIAFDLLLVAVARSQRIDSIRVLLVSGAVNGAIVQRRTRRITSVVQDSGGRLAADVERLLSGARPVGAIVSAAAMFAIIGVTIAKPA
jgi:hypothetical protein